MSNLKVGDYVKVVQAGPTWDGIMGEIFSISFDGHRYFVAGDYTHGFYGHQLVLQPTEYEFALRELGEGYFE
jgi:hypothetical protein